LEEVSYLDWNNSIEILNKAYESGLFVLIIGPKGTGKTSLVRDFAKNKNVNLESINFSLRTRESHLIGTKTLNEGTVSFDEGLLIKSMREGDMLYLDEINSAEADVLLRLDEALDAEEVFGTVEAVKTVSDLFMPLSGEIVEFNESLEDEPEKVNTDPYGDGWMIKIKLEMVTA